ncbi:RHS repeat-associated core domain-containing protein [Lignipirellula cremea]|uniref:RHS repeat-associated core domain-containing protein n=1 Tax=Lignipirellula cremea TaxID=2528010 RepID=UPI0018D1FDEC
MYQYRHRYFSPVLGRFLGRDPINGKSGREQFFIQPNYYLYCSSRPISFTDPDGLFELPIVTPGWMPYYCMTVPPFRCAGTCECSNIPLAGILAITLFLSAYVGIEHDCCAWSCLCTYVSLKGWTQPSRMTSCVQTRFRMLYPDDAFKIVCKCT